MKKLVFLFCLGMGIFCMAPAQQTPPQDSTVQAYLGKYTFPEGSVIADVTVSIENGSLIMTSSAGTSVLEKQAEDMFNIIQFRGTAKFNRDANKKITGVSINARGYQLEGTKVEATLGTR